MTVLCVNSVHLLQKYSVIFVTGISAHYEVVLKWNCSGLLDVTFMTPLCTRPDGAGVEGMRWAPHSNLTAVPFY